MTVNTKSVTDRRKLSYGSYDDLIADVDALAAGQTEVVGNWSFAQVCKHLAASMNACIDGVPFKAPWPFRLVGFLMKKRFLSKPVPPGFQIPTSGKNQFEPDETIDLQTQLAELHKAIERVKHDKTRAEHPILGKMSSDEWDQFNLRHAELHLSFVRPSNRS